MFAGKSETMTSSGAELVTSKAMSKVASLMPQKMREHLAAALGFTTTELLQVSSGDKTAMNILCQWVSKQGKQVATGRALYDALGSIGLTMIAEECKHLLLGEAVEAKSSGSLDEKRGGYDADFDPPLDEKNRCIICQFAMRDPVQTDPCGHRFCRSCLWPIMSGKQPRCPFTDCGEVVEAANPDNFCRREVFNSYVKCNNSIASCEWTGKLENLKDHLSVCPYSVVNCGYSDRGCSVKLQRRLLHDHMEKECAYGDITCQHSQKRMVKAEIEARAGLMAMDHMKSVVVSHDSLSLDTLQTILAKIEQQDKLIDYLLQQNQIPGPKCVEGKTVKLSQNLQANTGSTVSEESFRRLERQVNDTRLQAAQANHAATTASQIAEAARSRCIHVESQMAAINRTVGQNAEAATSRITNFEHRLAAVDRRLQAQETTSFNGIMTWKISDYIRHYDEARSGKKPSLYSPPFFTSRHGYKMCARVYLNGDGVGRNSHMSIFFAVMRGEFDSLLPWPFHQKVTITLLDQSPAEKHVSKTLHANLQCASFQRPTSEMTIASGCPTFVPIEIYQRSHGYVKENTVFIRIAVDRTGLTNY